jgi:integrase
MAPARPQPKGYIHQRGSRYWIAVPRGTDPVTKRYRYVYDSAATREEAERKRVELIERLAEGREPAEKATVSMLLDRWMDVADLALSTRVTHESYIERIIRPVLGDWPVRKLERRVDVLDQLYAHLRRCGKLCDGRRFIEHRTSDGAASRDAVDHDCAAAGCSPHVCRPMAGSTVRRIHSNISAAFGFAIKWGWADRNPADHASPPRLNRPDIEPPDPAQVARLLDVAWKRDPDFGTCPPRRWHCQPTLDAEH